MTDIDEVYSERQRLVAHLTGIYPSIMVEDGSDWPVLYISIPTGQISWHIGPTDIHMFKHVPRGEMKWDGHDTEEKYRRLDEYTKQLIKGL